MRTTAATLYRNSLAAIERASERLLDFQRQVSSGRRISRPSEDPQGTATAIAARGEVAGIEQYIRTADSATSRLTAIDSALSDIIGRLTAAQVSVVSAQGSTKTPAEREAAALAIEGVKDAVLADLNTVFQGAHLFAGAASTTTPYVVGAGGAVSAYQGSTREVEVDIDRVQTAVIGLDGSAIAQGGAASDVFAVLDSAAAAARSGDAAGLQQALVDLDAVFARATEAQTRVGTGLATIETQQSQLVDRRLASHTRLSKVEDANLAEAITGMTQAEASYRAALGATAQTTRQSLMDYLS